MENVSKINLSKEKNYDLNNLDLNDPKTLDTLELDKSDWMKAFVKFLIVTTIAIFVFFVPVNGSVPFGTIYGKAISIVESLVVINGQAVGALLLTTLILMGTGITSIIGKFFSKKDSKLYNYYKADSVIHPFLYMAGGIFIMMYFLNKIGVYAAPEMIVGASTGEMVIPGVVIGVAFIIPVGAFFIPFLTDYGRIDFFGILLEPLMRPLFKVPGKSAIDASASFVGSTTMGIIITGRMYNGNIYTAKESAIVATCFSAVSVGYGNTLL
jgi:nucleoside recognition membrane protein YjiH